MPHWESWPTGPNNFVTKGDAITVLHHEQRGVGWFGAFGGALIEAEVADLSLDRHMLQEVIRKKLQGRCVAKLKQMEDENRRQSVITQWVHQYNHTRPHQSLNHRPPVPETIASALSKDLVHTQGA